MIRAVAAVACAGLLAGCNTVVPYKDVYDGLLPAGYKLEQSTQALRPEQLKGKTVVLVTTTNFNTYTTTWQSHWEKGGAERREQTLQGAAEALAMLAPRSGATGLVQNMVGVNSGGGTEGVRQASDPRLVVQRVYTTLQPFFKEVKAANDFAQALDMKADYIALVDYFGTFNEWGDRYLARGGVYMLDGTLRRVFEVQGSADIPRPSGNPLGGAQGQYDILAQTYTKGLEATVGQLLPQARAKLEGR